MLTALFFHFTWFPLLFIGKMDQTDLCPFVNNFITEKLKGADFLALKCKISVQPFSLKSKTFKVLTLLKFCSKLYSVYCCYNTPKINGKKFAPVSKSDWEYRSVYHTLTENVLFFL